MSLTIAGLGAGGCAGRSPVVEGGTGHHSCRRVHMVGARLQRVGLARQTLADVSKVFASRNTNLGKPVPRTSRLAAVASHAHRACRATAASIGIFSG